MCREIKLSTRYERLALLLIRSKQRTDLFTLVSSFESDMCFLSLLQQVLYRV